MNRFKLSLRQAISAFHKAQAGISAIEFALVAPVMVCFLFGAIEISTMLITDKKVNNTVASVADLVAREPTMSADEIANIFNVGVILMAPNDYTNTRIRVSSVVWNDDEDNPATIVAWSQATSNWTALAVDSEVTVPAGLVPEDGSVIYAEVEFDYDSVTGLFDPQTGLLIKVPDTLGEDYWMRPRRVDIIPFS